MEKWIRKLLILVVLGSCAGNTKNLVKEGRLSLRGGKSGEFTWNKKMNLKRLSWFQGMSLIFDIYYYKFGPKDPFLNWMSKQDKEKASGCRELGVLLSYTQKERLYPKRSIELQLTDLGHEIILIEDFKKQMQGHQDFIDQGLFLYRIVGVCQRASGSVLKEKFTLPSFSASGFEE